MLSTDGGNTPTEYFEFNTNLLQSINLFKKQSQIIYKSSILTSMVFCSSWKRNVFDLPRINIIVNNLNLLIQQVCDIYIKVDQSVIYKSVLQTKLMCTLSFVFATCQKWNV